MSWTVSRWPPALSAETPRLLAVTRTEPPLLPPPQDQTMWTMELTLEVTGPSGGTLTTQSSYHSHGGGSRSSPVGSQGQEETQLIIFRVILIGNSSLRWSELRSVEKRSLPRSLFLFWPDLSPGQNRMIISLLLLSLAVIVASQDMEPQVVRTSISSI